MKISPLLLPCLALSLLAAEPAAERPARIVRLDHPHRAEIAQNVVKTGTLVAPAQVDICAKIGGRLAALQLEDGTPVEEGVRVKKGQRIALIEDREYRAALAAAEAGLQAAEATLVDATREYNRAKALFEDGTATAQERDTAQAAFERAEASVAQAKAQRETAQISLDETVLVAPMDGIVSARAVDPGALLAVGARVVTLTEVDWLRFQIYVSTSFYGALTRPGVPMDVVVDAYPDETVHAKISRVYPVADEATRTVLVEARIDNPEGKYLPGMFAVGTLNLNRRENAIVVPYDCVVRNVKQHIVYVHRDGVAHAVEVKLGIRDDAVVEVVAGLDVTDEIVVAGQHRLTDGAPIRPEVADLPFRD